MNSTAQTFAIDWPYLKLDDQRTSAADIEALLSQLMSDEQDMHGIERTIPDIDDFGDGNEGLWVCLFSQIIGRLCESTRNSATNVILKFGEPIMMLDTKTAKPCKDFPLNWEFYGVLSPVTVQRLAEVGSPMPYDQLLPHYERFMGERHDEFRLAPSFDIFKSYCEFWLRIFAVYR